MIPPARESRSRRRGLVILGIVAVLAGATLVIDSILPGGRAAYELVAILPGVTGVRPGTPVTVAGWRVGSVLVVRMHEEPGSRHAFALHLAIDRAAAPMIRADSRLGVSRPGLFGPPSLEIEPGSAGAPALEHGDTIRTRPPVLPGTIPDRVSRITTGLAGLTESLDTLRSLTGVSVVNYQELVTELGRLGVELDAVAAAYRDGAAAVPDVERLIALADQVSAVVASGRSRWSALGDSASGPLPRITELHRRLTTIADHLTNAGGFPARLAADSALQAALHSVRAQIDSLFAEISRNPLDFAF